MNKLLLALDTSTKMASVALYDGVNVRAEMSWEAPRRHTTELAPRVAAILEELRLDASKLTGLAVALGPGSFTGLRIGLALAKGIALARSVPLVGIPTLDVTVYPIHRRPATLYATLQAGRGRICVAPYRWHHKRWRQADELTITTWAKLFEEAEADALLCGEVNAKALEILADYDGKLQVVPAAHRLRRAGYLAELGWRRLQRGERDDPAALQPIYLHTV
jgi:tRNA threonylcarbamoyladenosine biosynthesis protein TsaB